MKKNWKNCRILEGKTIVLSGCSSGIGLETARLIKELGGNVFGVDKTKTTKYVDELYIADLSDPRVIDALIEALPEGCNGLCNCAGLPPTAKAELVIKVNLVGLKYFTEGFVPKMADGSSIVNVASLAGFGWQQAVDTIQAAQNLDFDEVESFIQKYNITNEGGRSYFFTKEALVVWTMQNRWKWRDRGIRMNSISPGPVETPILKDFLETLGERAEEDRKIMDRPGRPEDLAPIITFLLSDMTTWIRGTNIPTDGGMSSHLLCNIHKL